MISLIQMLYDKQGKTFMVSEHNPELSNYILTVVNWFLITTLYLYGLN